MKLYYSPGSCSLSPHIVAREAGLPVEAQKVIFGPDSSRTAEGGEDYYAINPLGYVPALRLDSGEVLTEGVAIVQYLADQAPQAHLMPSYQSADYYRALEWLTFISSELHKGFSPLFRKDLPEGEKARVVERIGKRLAYLNEYLAGQEYLVGGAFSVADAYCFTILRWHPRADIDLAAYPNIAAYYARIMARPAVAAAMREQGLV